MSEPHNPYVGSKITNIRLGSRSKGRGHIIYANLVGADDELLISATLDYILDALKSRLPPTP
jgi:hypothetical protein